MSYFVRAMRVMAILGEWSVEALADGKVTLEEAMKLVLKLADALDLPVAFDINEVLK